MLLHAVFTSPDNDHALASCLRVALPDSCILLLQDAVYAAYTNSTHASRLRESGSRIYALREDVEARGLCGALDEGIELVDYAGFVELSVECHAVQSWY
ncbi:MAG: sulfurtransferase complex subunit TusB [Halieaceae bacterium]